LEKLRLEYLNKEETRCIEKTCFDYQDVFYLPGDKISCTNAVKHAINLVRGMGPINGRPYRLPESQNQEVDRQVTKRLQEKSDSSWNSSILVVPKKTGKDGKQQWRLVVDFRRLIEKALGTLIPT